MKKEYNSKRMEEKYCSYQTTNSYVTLNSLGSKTKNIWLLFHGMGYLSRYFLRAFTILNPEENYFIAPQAPSKYYLNDEFKYVGASWLTKENTRLETQNVIRYIDSVISEEEIFGNEKLILFGFSQGVSIVIRWMAAKQIQCKKLILYAGGIPEELDKDDFAYLNFNTTEVCIIYGETDKYLTPERLKTEKEKIEKIFGNRVQIIHFKGGHEIKQEILQQLI